MMTVAFFTEDIVSEVWKHIPFSAMKVVSGTSKEFAYNYNKMTIYDKATAHYKEMGCLSKYCSKIAEETCEKYEYKKPKFISTFCQYVEIKDSSKKKLNYYLLSVMIVILTHAVNKRYREILKTINGTIYPKSDERAIIMLITEILNESAYKTYGASYTWETRRILKMVSMFYLFKITENQFLMTHSFRKVREEKLTMLKYELGSTPCIPKYFKEALEKLLI